FLFQAEDGIRSFHVTGVQTCALPISQHVVPLPPELAGDHIVLLEIFARLLDASLEILQPASCFILPVVHVSLQSVLCTRSRQFEDAAARPDVPETMIPSPTACCPAPSGSP